MLGFELHFSQNLWKYLIIKRQNNQHNCVITAHFGDNIIIVKSVKLIICSFKATYSFRTKTTLK